MFPIKDENPTKRFPVVTVFLIFLNIIIFFYQSALGPRGQLEFIYTWGAIPHYIESPLQLTILTSMFLHGGLFHVGTNMLYLWIFGNNVEDFMGRGRFILFYLLCGYLAAYAHIYRYPESETPIVGASGAISGIMGAYILLYPRARVLCLVFLGFFFTFIKVPAFAVLGLWIIIQVINGSMALGRETGVAWFAHIGGFLTGLLIIALFTRRRYRRTF